MDSGYIAISAAGLVALIYTLTNYFRYLLNIGDKDARDSFKNQTLAYLVSIATVFLAGSASDTFGSVKFVPTSTISNLSSPSKLMLGLVLGGAGGVVTKLVQSFDANQNASVPSVPGK